MTISQIEWTRKRKEKKEKKKKKVNELVTVFPTLC